MSEELGENAIEILVGIAVEGLFPESSARWRTAKKEIRARCKQDLAMKEDTVRQEIARGEGSLRHALHEAVTKDVMDIFPYDSVPVTSPKARIANALAYCRSIERDRLSPASDDLRTDPEASGKGLCEAKWWLIVFLACMRISDLESLYHNFQSTYQAHMQKAGFVNVLQRNSYFAAWKLRLISIRSLFERHRPLPPEMRSDLIQKILFEGNFWHAQQILTKLEDRKSPNVGIRGTGSRFHGPIGSEDALKREMKKLAASVSDSQFLLDIKKIGDQEI